MIKQVINLKPNISDLKIKDLINSLLKLGNVMDISYHKQKHQLSFHYEKNQLDNNRLKQLISEYEVSNRHQSEELFTYTFNVLNLHCINCAKKIEKNLGKIPGVEVVNLDFLNKKLLITGKDNNVKNLLKQLNYVANKCEPGTKISEINEIEPRHNQIFAILTGIIIFIVANLSVFSVNLNFALFLIAFTVIGYSVLEKAIFNILRGQLFDENFLMSIACIGALIIGEYHEAFAVMFLYQIGEMLQKKAVEKSRKAISKTIEIQPKYANLILKDEIKTVDPKYVRVNDLILIKPGEKIPLDGIVIGGSSAIDKAQLTGESLPVNIEVDDQVLAGSINLSGTIEVKVTKPYEDSTLAKIFNLIDESHINKAKSEKFITRFARVYTPIIVFLAILIIVLPIVFVSDYDFNTYLYKACVFLVLSCPCALVLSVPLSIFAGIGKASNLGIIVKGGNHFDTLRQAKMLILDKTGTLTSGKFVVLKAKAAIGYNYQDFLTYANYASIYSNHFISIAICDYVNQKINPKRIESHDEQFGLGVRAIIDKNEVLVGNTKLLDKYNVTYKQVEDDGKIIYVAVKGKLIGYFVISDKIKENAKEVIQEAKKQGLKTVMLTGDNDKMAYLIAKELNIDEYYANLLPDEKVNVLKRIKNEDPHLKTIYVGDGVNDAPVLALSDVGIAVNGSDAAIEVSNIVLANDNLINVIRSREIAIKTHQKITQNIILSLSIKILILVLGILGYANIWAAVFADVGVTLLAVLNSISILTNKKSS